MPKSLTVFLSLLLLLPIGCKEAERPQDIYVTDLRDLNEDPNFLTYRKVYPDRNSHHRSGFIIRPDTSKDHKIMIIPADPNIDPGIFITGKRQSKIYSDSSLKFFEPNESNDIFLTP